MERSIEIGDFAIVTQLGFSPATYVIRQINQNGIYVSPDVNSNTLSLIVSDPSIPHGWKIYGSNAAYVIEFQANIGTHIENQQTNILSEDLNLTENETTNHILELSCENVRQKLAKSKKIGSGSSGKVYEYCVNNVCYAVKMESPYIDSFEEDYENAKYSERITNISHNAGLSPKIYRVMKCVIEDKHFLITVMDLVRGNTLVEYLDLTGDYDILIDLLAETRKLHSLGIYHGDLNNTNVIITESKQIQFIDFLKGADCYKQSIDFISILSGLIRYALDRQVITTLIPYMLIIIDNINDDGTNPAITKIISFSKVLNVDPVDFNTENIRTLNTMFFHSREVLYYYC